MPLHEPLAFAENGVASGAPPSRDPERSFLAYQRRKIALWEEGGWSALGQRP